MTLFDPPEFENNAVLFVSSVDFPQVLALPVRRSLPEGDVLTFRFSNGYGAVVTRLAGRDAAVAFEFGVLDCSAAEARLTFLTPVCADVQHGLSYEQVAQLLPRAERLPRHPHLVSADESLQLEDF